jgi:hypothetical protein
MYIKSPPITSFSSAFVTCCNPFQMPGLIEKQIKSNPKDIKVNSLEISEIFQLQSITVACLHRTFSIVIVNVYDMVSDM